LTPLEEAWADFIQSRSEIRKPLTKIAIKKLRNKLAILSHGNDRLAIAILDQSSERGWQGLFALNEQNAEMFRVSELELIRTRTTPCQYCQKPITESQRWTHEDSQCPNYKAKDKQEVMDIIGSLRMGAN